MYKFKDILANAGPSLVDLLPDNSLSLLALLNPDLATPVSVRKYIHNIVSPESLLLNKSERWTILKLLPLENAKELCQLLGYTDNEPYVFLKNNSFSGNRRKKILLEYFCLEYREEVKEIIPSKESIECNYGLFEHQTNALNKISEFLIKKKGRVMLHMPTGSGKTRTAITFASEYLRKKKATVIWLASQEELCEQAYTEFKIAWPFLGNRQINSYRFWGNHEQPNNFDDGFIVMGLDKANSILQSDSRFLVDLPNNALIIFDEAHQAIAPTYSRVTEFLIGPNGSGKLLGLTATPGRDLLDIDKDKELSDFFNNNKVSLQVEGYDNPIKYLIDSEYIAKPNFINVEGLKNANLSPSDLANLADGRDLTPETLKRLGADTARNAKIIDKCLEVLKKHKRVIVFATSVDQSNALAVVMAAEGYDAVSVSSKSSPQDRSRFIKSFKEDSNERKIIFNYGILTTGFDAPKTSAVIVARPTTSLVLYSQMIGRALRGRRAGGNKEADIYTVMDGGIKVFNDITEAFINWEDVWNGT